MLSKSASNALLKTLEEPPEGLVFVLATTEPEKLPPTILSRTQHFRFRRLSEGEIESKLEHLTREAGVEAEAGALALVARAADGAMRDAESLLERLLASGATITLKDTERALGLPPQTRLQTLARSLAERDLNTMLGEASALYRDGFAPRSLAERLTLELRNALYTQVGLDEGFSLSLSEDDLLRVIHALDDEMERFVRYDDLFSLEVALIKAVNALSQNAPRPVAESASETTQGSQQGSQPQPAQPAPRPAPTTSAASDLPDFNPTGRPAPVSPALCRYTPLKHAYAGRAHSAVYASRQTRTPQSVVAHRAEPSRNAAQSVYAARQSRHRRRGYLFTVCRHAQVSLYPA